MCWVELADLRSELGERSHAIAAIEKALALGAATNVNTPEAVGYHQLWRSDPGAAADAFNAAIADTPERSGEPWYRTYTRACLSLGLGRARMALNQPDEAVTALERSITLLEALARDRPAVPIERRLGRARAELARMRAAMGASPERTRTLAAAALAWLQAAGAQPGEIAELQRLTELPRTVDSPR
jgi:tetratricopeptide (TPR) repeat protein